MFSQFIRRQTSSYLYEQEELFTVISNLEAGFPSIDGQDNEIEFSEIIAEHLADEEVAVFMEAGHEKSRYVVGCALAINNKGETKFISIDDIYKSAESLGKNITKAEAPI